jgi:hypothetical protein
VSRWQFMILVFHVEINKVPSQGHDIYEITFAANGVWEYVAPRAPTSMLAMNFKSVLGRD